MGTYSIKDLERLCGIKAHTIRAWENRYKIISPNRTNTNIRIYDDNQLKKLLNVSLLTNNGYKISKVSKFSQSELNKLLTKLYEEANDHIINKPEEIQINALMVAMIDLEEEKFDKIFSNNILRLGFEKTITRIIYPFLEKVGLMWGIDEINPAQEHFISNLIRQKVIVAIDALPVAPKDAETFLLFLPEKELHEIGLLMAHYLLKANGKQIVYLGQNVPYEDLKKVCEICDPDAMLTFMVMPQSKDDITQYLHQLAKDHPQKTLLVSAAKQTLEGIERPKNMHWLTSMTDLKAFYA